MKAHIAANFVLAVLVLVPLVFGAWHAAPAMAASITPAPAVDSPNPFGLMIAAEGVTTAGIVDIARGLGVDYYRPGKAVFVETWDGRCAECDAARQAGMQLVLTVRASGSPGAPSAPPANLDEYRTRLGAILDTTRPAILVVENEESSDLFYTGTPQQYGVVLQAACQVAHARQVECTNGGMVSALVALLTWENLRARGDVRKACDFAWRTFDGPNQPVTPQALCRARSAADLPQAAQQMMARGRDLLAAYRTSGIDAVNFHWYIADAQALGQSIAFLRNQTGLPALTNEIGQHDEEPATPPALLAKAAENNLACVVWFSMDLSEARSLLNADWSLRPNGVAFRDYVLSYGGLQPALAAMQEQQPAYR